MKKFQKILSAGLILSQVFSVSANSNDNTKQQHLSIRASKDDSKVTINPNRKQKGSLSTVGQAFELYKSYGTVNGVLQMLFYAMRTCYSTGDIKKVLANYTDSSEFKFSEIVDLDASLKNFEFLVKLVEKKPGDFSNFETTLDNLLSEKLIFEEIRGGWRQAIKIASLGFAEDIYVQRVSGTNFKFYYMPGGYSDGLLQDLIDRLNKIKGDFCVSSDNQDKMDKIIGILKNRQKTLQSCVSYKIWANVTWPVTTVRKAVGAIKDNNPSKKGKEASDDPSEKDEKASRSPSGRSNENILESLEVPMMGGMAKAGK